MFKKNNKNNEEIISMEQTTFVQRHAKKILLAGGVTVAIGAGYLLKKHNLDIAEHALRIFNLETEVKSIKIKLDANTKAAISALENTIQNYDFEIAELIFKRDNLNDKAAANIFMNIPKLNEEIEMKTLLKEAAEKALAEVIETGKTE